jgi:hypothetical protein
MMERVLCLALTVYALTFVITSGAIFEPMRGWIMRRTPMLRIGGHKHFIECRMCIGFWCALAICGMDYKMILPVYGLSYFLATQERL